MLTNHVPGEHPWFVISGIEVRFLAALENHLIIANTEGIVATANSAIRRTIFFLRGSLTSDARKLRLQAPFDTVPRSPNSSNHKAW